MAHLAYQQPPANSDYTYLIYRTDGITRNSNITTVSNELLYKVHFIETNDGDWVITFMIDTEPPQIAMQAQKRANQNDFDVTDYTKNYRTLFVRPPGNRNSHFFSNNDGKLYAWEQNGNGNAFLLLAYPERTQIAYFERIGETVNNQCKVVVTAQAHHMLSLIFSTGFSIQEWELEEQRLQKTRPIVPVFYQGSGSGFFMGNYQLHQLKQQNDRMIALHTFNTSSRIHEQHRRDEAHRRHTNMLQQQLLQQQQMNNNFHNAHRHHHTSHASHAHRHHHTHRH
ncbi:hypothetical protein HDV06_001372 [Boothiomyces sp. JEL0866]|nr:hypothetical protein HDV06_001372 [Boothiomyces sp. JEL0866]